jgi:hypothetical protein
MRLKLEVKPILIISQNPSFKRKEPHIWGGLNALFRFDNKGNNDMWEKKEKKEKKEKYFQRRYCIKP